MNRIQAFFNQQHGLPTKVNYDFALRRLCVAKEDSWLGIEPSNNGPDFNPEPPIFAAKFANCDGYRHLIAIANEDGKIALQDTTVRNKKSQEQSLEAMQCHNNAVFDVEWAPGEMRFVSASGDHSAHLWDVHEHGLIGIREFLGHTRSVKTVAFRKNDPSVFATGGRDGAIIIWDTRAKLNVDCTPRADNCIYSGHVGGPGTPSLRKRPRMPKTPQSNVVTSITGLAFQDENTLISCGAGDGVIKVWDLRRNYTAFKKEPHPKHSLPYPGSKTFKGFSNLIIDRAGTRLFANCMDNNIYCYNLCTYSPKPMAAYKGAKIDTYYIKSCLSPDEKYLLSGGSDEKAYIWNLDYAQEPLVVLEGHTVEVTCVAWGATFDRPIVTCGDDTCHKIWRIGPEQISDADRAELYRGSAKYVRQFAKKTTGSTHKYFLRDLESTPRSLKRLGDQMDRTPSSVEKQTPKRSFLDMLGAVASADVSEDQEPKRQKTFETRARRLFSPSTSVSIGLSVLGEEQQNCAPSCSSTNHHNVHKENNADSHLPCTATKTLQPLTPLSPLNDRISLENLNKPYTSPPSTSSASLLNNTTTDGSALIYSPTSNLPNYVIDGEAPHLSLMSPKRKHKDKIDWLTKMRKQKLLSTPRSCKLTERMSSLRANSDTNTSQAADVPCSPRVHSLRCAEGSPRFSTTPRRRISHTATQSEPRSPSASTSFHPNTPSSSRRNSETTLLRFFSLQGQQQQSTACGDAAHATQPSDELQSFALTSQ